ncbi:tigger transposable element-derived protein 6-like [Haliotis rubra]|uniref:tigger transposable element-derived protein 6-like n=1 Tax=Haliotis rubra TaxID=36100 RepID=UPI001EE5C225|nr:tigger transposable element-derived protein 6-like [Haliotis rubra]
MTSELFSDWLRHFDRSMRLKGRTVILLLDNAASHNHKEVRLTNVTVPSLRPNTTAHIQPMDAGIIRNFNALYKKSLVKHFITCAENGQPQMLTLRLAIRFVKSAWDEVSAKCINNCYKHVDIIPTTAQTEDESDDDISLAELRNFMQQLPRSDGDEVPTAEQYVDEDTVVDTGHELTDEEIINRVQPPTDDQSDDEDQPAVVPPTVAEALQHTDR